jgi:hypothetical protein
MKKHKGTPLPWFAVKNENYDVIEIRSDSREGMVEIATVDIGFAGPIEIEQLANSDFIVTACNNHEALVEALTKITEYIDNEGPPAKEWEAITEWCEKGKAALARVREGK